MHQQQSAGSTLWKAAGAPSPQQQTTYPCSARDRLHTAHVRGERKKVELVVDNHAAAAARQRQQEALIETPVNLLMRLGTVARVHVLRAAETVPPINGRKIYLRYSLFIQYFNCTI